MGLNICSQCNSNNIRKGILRAGNAPLHMFPGELDIEKGPLNSHLRKSSKINSYYCQDCGYILGSFLDDPNKLI